MRFYPCAHNFDLPDIIPGLGFSGARDAADAGVTVFAP